MSETMSRTEYVLRDQLQTATDNLSWWQDEKSRTRWIADQQRSAECWLCRVLAALIEYYTDHGSPHEGSGG